MYTNPSIATLAVALISGAMLSSAAMAQDEAHSDVLVGRPEVGTQTLVGGANVPDDLNLDERVFEGDLGTRFPGGGTNGVYFATEPGFFNAGSQSPGLLGAENPEGLLALAPGESVTVSQAAPLQYWDGVVPVAFVPTTATLIITPIADTAGPNGELDDHPLFDIDGPTDTLPAGGIYLATLTAELDGLSASDEFSILFVTGDEFEDAVEVAEEYLSVPEPGAAALVACLGLAAALRRRQTI